MCTSTHTETTNRRLSPPIASAHTSTPLATSIPSKEPERTEESLAMPGGNDLPLEAPAVGDMHVTSHARPPSPIPYVTEHSVEAGEPTWLYEVRWAYRNAPLAERGGSPVHPTYKRRPR